MTIEEKRRELFEADLIARSPGSIYLLDRRPRGKYRNHYVQSAWEGFNAALDAVVIELPESYSPSKAEQHRHAAKYNECLDDCRAAIESTGFGLTVLP